jgi:RNA-directed DNA polymerase
LHLEIVRYADDFVVIHEEKEVIEESKRYIEQWLEVRGLSFSEEKTKIVHSTEGFNFLGCHIKHYENRIKGTYRVKLLNGTKTERNRANATHVMRIEPMKEKVIAHWRKVSDKIWSLRNSTCRCGNQRNTTHDYGLGERLQGTSRKRSFQQT